MSINEQARAARALLGAKNLAGKARPRVGK